ncbi:hypothetical protein MHY1_p00118 (plasmid) [Methylovirgula sp. HY1]|nr:hypothetical protein MHY1_p00118 [Methylovirgula sp. HY1]
MITLVDVFNRLSIFLGNLLLNLHLLVINQLRRLVDILVIRVGVCED